MLTSDDNDNILNQYQEFLKEFVDPDHGILDKLRYKKALTTEEILEVEALPTYIRRNSKLLEYISTKCKYDDFFSALRESCQSHIANYVEANGDYSGEYGNNWPLTDHQKSMLDVNEETLVDLLDLDSGLLTSLYSMKVINKRQMQTISSKSTEFQRIKALLDMLRRCSISDYRKTIKCLHKTNQNHIASILEEGGVVVKIHSEIGDELTEDEIIANFANVLQNKPLDESRRILESTLNVIALKKSKSIIIYILCKNSRELLHLRYMRQKGDLRLEVKKLFMQLLTPPMIIEATTDNLYVTIEAVFKQLLYKSQVDDVVVCFPESEHERYKTKYAILENSTISKTNVDDLPLELLDIILQKSYVRSVLNVDRSVDFEEDGDVFRHLATVDWCWSQRMTRISFKREIWSKIRTSNRQENGEYALYRSNRQSLQEMLKIPVKTRTMELADYLSAIDCALLKKQKPSKSRSPCDVSYLPVKKEVEMNLLTRNLDQRGNKIRRKVIFNGGAALRVEILCYNVRNKVEHIRQLAERLNHVIHDYASRSHDQKMTIDQLKCDGIELLYAVEDRDDVVWILCKSRDSIEEFMNRNRSQSLLDLFYHLCHFNEVMKPRRVNIDYGQCTKEIGEPSKFTARFIADIGLKNKYMVCHSGITKLRDRIYVLCRFRVTLSLDIVGYHSKVYVLEDKSPFHMKNEIELEDNTFLTEIKSCEKQNCLYVLACKYNNYCVWKIVQNEQLELEFNRTWVQCEENFQPRILYLSPDDQLVAATARSPVDLRAYSPNAELLFAIQLHEDIDNAWGLVESSNGNFLILHTIKQEERIGKEDEDDHDEVEQLKWTVSEVSRDGKAIVRRFIPQRCEQVFGSHATYYLCDLCIDSEDRLFIADTYNARVILLDSCLQWAGVLISTREHRQENCPPSMVQKIFYDEIKGQFLLEDPDKISVYVLKRKYF